VTKFRINAHCEFYNNDFSAPLINAKKLFHIVVSRPITNGCIDSLCDNYTVGKGEFIFRLKQGVNNIWRGRQQKIVYVGFVDELCASGHL